MAEPADPTSKRRASLSMEAVVGAAVALLDERGEAALTFRALASRLGGGVGSVYWYVANKDELLDRASDHVLADVLRITEQHTDIPDPIDALRAMATALFDVLETRPWLTGYFLRDTDTQPNGMLLYERLGQQVLRLSLAPRQSFEAVSAIFGFVVGTAADLGHEPAASEQDDDAGRDELLAQHVEEWRALPREQFPYVHYILDEFAAHHDRDQFLAGLDLLLAGLRLQAEQ